MQVLTAAWVAGCCISCLLHAGANNGVAAAAGQVDFSPAFIWLLRDFQLRLEAEGKPITPAEYLEEALLPIKGGAADIANKNQVWPSWRRQAVPASLRVSLCKCSAPRVQSTVKGTLCAV
jgi:hypothetical protein